jgi:hypothetical protein
MQRKLPIIDFASEAAGLLKDFFAWWMPRPRLWTSSLRQPGRPILEAVQPAHRPAAAGRS